MKIGIMSMQRIVNYGSFLQAYALKETVKNITGAEVEFVDYTIGKALISNCDCKAKKQDGKIIRALKLLNPKNFIKRKQEIECNKSFKKYYDDFVRENLPVLKIDSEKNIRPELDILIIGSDEVFNCTQPGETVGYSLELFGANNRAKKLISYAASFGNTTIDKINKYEINNELAKYLKNFDAISVRDINSYKIIEMLTNKKSVYNLDPVLIYDFENEVNDDIDVKDYIVVYAYSGRIGEVEADYIKKFAKRQGKKILTLGFKQKISDICIQSASPFDVLKYIKYADYVITDTFHGTVFSIKYGKRFATFIRNSNKEKLTDLLERFNLSERGVSSYNEMESVLTKNVDKKYIDEKIYFEKINTVNYIKSNCC